MKTIPVRTASEMHVAPQIFSVGNMGGIRRGTKGGTRVGSRGGTRSDTRGGTTGGNTSGSEAAYFLLKRFLKTNSLILHFWFLLGYSTS